MAGKIAEKAEEKGIEKGQQEMVMQIITVRFPSLVPLAQPRVQQIHRGEELKKLLADLLTAPDEKTVLALLRLPSA